MEKAAIAIITVIPSAPCATVDDLIISGRAFASDVSDATLRHTIVSQTTNEQLQ